MRLIAIGGGGFTAATDPGLDELVLAQIPALQKKVGFIGTASGNDQTRLDRFRTILAPRLKVATVLPSSADAAFAESWVADLDAIYVGGGDTERLLGEWRANGLDRILLAATRRGLLIAGVSAGAVCWFDHALVRGGGGRLGLIRGLSLSSGCCCAHFSSETDRRQGLIDEVENGTLEASLAIDDGVAVLIENERPPRAFTARPEHGAYVLSRRRDTGRALFAPIPFL